jgi:hypothetical protein
MIEMATWRPDSGVSALQTAIRMLRDRSDRYVAIDVSDVGVVGGARLAAIVEVQRLLNDCGHRLTLCLQKTGFPPW